MGIEFVEWNDDPYVTSNEQLCARPLYNSSRCSNLTIQFIYFI